MYNSIAMLHVQQYKLWNDNYIYIRYKPIPFESDWCTPNHLKWNTANKLSKIVQKA